MLLDARLPVHGHYLLDLFPAFLLGGIGMGFVFVPMTIGALAGVGQSDAGVASGLINTSRQIGGAIGVAVTTTIAATYTSHYLAGHPGTAPTGAAALTHGFEIAFYVLAGVTMLAALASALVIESRPAEAEDGVEAGEVALEAAA